jgi:antitoxin MazE
MAARETLTAEIVPIGNSRGLRIPKGIREQLGLAGKVTLTVAEGALVVRPERGPRADWRERFAKAGHAAKEPLLIPDQLGTGFDAEWTW